ncbi:hypothetical protein [Maridesulfovibrio bastinii]|uniref:hypothetical protein n=1 Tax=Maridesulfovibrio bastinii TaxID=47157 RepID=UPI0003FF9ADD|nr:hypothetical protein [Maridesulfovibrio bastinii]
MIEQLHSGYKTQALTYTNQGKRAQNSIRQSASGDSVSLSDGGKLLSDFFSGLGINNSSGGAVSLSELESGLQEKQQNLNDRINTLFSKNGISTDPEVSLTSDSEGHIKVAGNHPDKDKIESLLNSSPEILKDFQAVSGLSTLTDAGQEYSDFAAMYKTDPYGAVSKYSYLFEGGSAENFSMKITDSAPATSAEETETNDQEKPDFSSLTRSDLMDWVNDEIKSGRMTVKDSTPFVSLSLGSADENGKPINIADDTNKYDFIKLAQNGIEGALYFGETDLAESLQYALGIMTG